MTKNRNAGISRKGKIWSLRSGSLAEWRRWCEIIGEKLSDFYTTPDDFLRYTLVPTSIAKLPNCPALKADWPDHSYEFDDCEIELSDWAPGGESFRFQLDW